MKTVAIIGASANPNRYSNMAQQRLLAAGHQPILITPNYESIDGLPCIDSISAAPDDIDTVTIYINPALIDNVIADIIAKQPKRVIFNPGSESVSAMQQLTDNGIEVVEACTLVMLATNQF